MFHFEIYVSHYTVYSMALGDWRGKKIHFIGIKGIGMLGLAQLLRHEGAIVSGSDTAEEFPSDAVLKEADIRAEIFSEANITASLDLVVYSSAYTESHPERKKARAFGIAEISYAEALEAYARDKKTIVITGTHGKTTTTALIAHIMEIAGLAPTALVGGIARNWKNSVLLPHLAVQPPSESPSGGQLGGSTAKLETAEGRYFVVEGDEYQEKFAKFMPWGLIITSLDYDHSDYYPTRERYLDVFRSYIAAHAVTPVIAEEDAEKLSLGAYAPPEAEDEKIFAAAHFLLPGEAYRKDALLAVRFARSLGVSPNSIKTALSNFKGVARRLDRVSPEGAAVIILSDYAHHPDEIRATLVAIKSEYPGRKIVAVFQPHTYTRTERFAEEFAASFGDADEVFFDEIYGSARETKGNVRIEDILERAKAAGKNASLLRGLWPDAFVEKIKNEPSALVIMMGAGDIWQKARELSQALYG